MLSIIVRTPSREGFFPFKSKTILIFHWKNSQRPPVSLQSFPEWYNPPKPYICFWTGKTLPPTATKYHFSRKDKSGMRILTLTWRVVRRRTSKKKSEEEAFWIAYHQHLPLANPFSLTVRLHLTENLAGRSSGEPYIPNNEFRIYLFIYFYLFYYRPEKNFRKVSFWVVSVILFYYPLGKEFFWRT